MLKLKMGDKNTLNIIVFTVVAILFAMYVISHYSEGTCDSLGLRYVGKPTNPEEVM